MLRALSILLPSSGSASAIVSMLLRVPPEEGALIVASARHLAGIGLYGLRGVRRAR